MELIPEFYCPMSTDFLENRLGLNIPRPATSGNVTLYTLLVVL